MSILATTSTEQFQEMKAEEMTLLHHVAFDGNLEALEMLKSLPYYKEIVDTDNNDQGWTPLLWAASNCDLNMIKALIESGAQPLKPKRDGATILHIGACTNDLRMLDYVYKLR